MSKAWTVTGKDKDARRKAARPRLWLTVLSLAAFALLIALGVLTSFAAFIASGEMAFAYFTQHFPRGFWPIQNGGELAVLNCFLFLYIAANGAGMCGVWRLRRDL